MDEVPTPPLPQAKTGLLALWPDQLSDHAAEVDWLLWSFTGLLAALVIPIFVLLVWFLIRYRQGNTQVDRSQPVHRSLWLELSWVVIPFALAMIFFV